MSCEFEKKKEKLRFIDGKFKLLQLADLHFEKTDAIIKSNNEITSTLLDLETPDMVVFSGDQVSGWTSNKPGFYQEMISITHKPLVDRRTKWASVLGNHDREADLSPSEIMCNDAKNSLSYTLQGMYNPNNSLDYILPIYSSDNSTVKVWLIMLDSGRNLCEGVDKTAGCVSKSQLDWLNSTFTPDLYANTAAFVFVHQPIPEFNSIVYQAKRWGSWGERVSCPAVQTRIYNILKRFAVVRGVYIGHDHDNDFYGRLGNDEPVLTYGRKTGFGSYGPNGLERGARVVNIVDQDGTLGFESWISTAKGREPNQKLYNPDPFSFKECGEFVSHGWIILMFAVSVVLVITWAVIYRRSVARICKKYFVFEKIPGGHEYEMV